MFSKEKHGCGWELEYNSPEDVVDQEVEGLKLENVVLW